MKALWQQIGPTPIDALSPSALNGLLACPMRVAFQRNDSTQHWRRGTPATALGIVAHRLTELAAFGKPDDGSTVAEWLASNWGQLVEEQFRTLEEQWPLRDVPNPTAWRGYAVTKVRLVKQLITTTITKAAVFKPAALATPPRGAPPLPWVERRLDDQRLGLFGTPDRVDMSAGQLRVVDLKSGVSQAGITEAQRRQLLFYAHLVSVQLAQLPSLGVIVGAKGDETELPITSAAVEELLERAKEEVEDFNAAVRVGKVVARPSSENCRWCPFRVECGAYWEAIDEAWSLQGELCGEVVAASESELTVRLVLPSFDAGRLVRLIRVGREPVPHEGDMVVAVDTDPAGVDAFRMRWNSRVRVITASA